VFVDTAADSAQSNDAVLDYSMCVNKVLQMQRVFLTERETDNSKNSNISDTTPTVLTEANDASVAASSSLTMDTAGTDVSDPPAAESNEVTSSL